MIPKIYQPCLIEGFDDFLFTFKTLLSGEQVKHVKSIREEKVTKDEYIDLYSPALEWLLQNIGHNTTHTTRHAQNNTANEREKMML